MQIRVKRQGAKENMNVCVAEDDAFQRVAIIDLLQLCGFTVIACENGIQARDELLKKENEFDLILLDLIMPELNGLELLKLIRSIDNLKELPVIMMSSDGEMEVVAACLNAGAQDYLVKPVNFKKLQGLQEFARKKPKQKNKNSNEKDCYEVIRNIGKGACGSVELVRRSNDSENFAMKVIPMYYMNESEKKNAENEVSLLKVLTAPTIIKYYESFVEGDCLNIIMEYAEGGSVCDKISEHNRLGTSIPKDQILSWLAQLVIAIHFMHSKNILHRDIKTQNMFLNKQNIIKLGDFGISKALGTHGNFADTFLGTPYFMPPEVIRGDKYDKKADIWALGCALYELVMLKRPFQHDVMQMVFNMIQNQPYEMNQNIDKELQMLLEKMLQKDPQKRPFIQDIANIPCIEEKINQFYEQYPNESNLIFLRNLQVKPEDELLGSDYQGGSNSDENPLTAISLLMQSIQYRKVCYGFFNQVEYVAVTGFDILVALQMAYDRKVGDEIQQLGQILFEEQWIRPLEGQQAILNQKNSYYSFPCFLPFIDANSYQQYTGNSQDILYITDKLIKNFKQFQFTISNNKKINLELLQNNFKAYMDLVQQTKQLQKATLIDYQNTKKLAVFVNIYQIMRIHKALRSFFTDYLKKKGNIVKEPKSFLKNLVGTILPPQEIEWEFSYVINGLRYMYSDVKHGVLRSNRAAPRYKQLPKGDQRLLPMETTGVVALFLEDYQECTNEDQLMWEINYVDESNVYAYIQNSIKTFIRKYVCLDVIEQEIIIHPLLQTYQCDFGKTQKDLLEWLLGNIGKNYNIRQILEQYDQQEFYIRFKDPNIL